MKNTKKTYQGKITAIKLINCNVYGIKTFEIHFATGIAIYQVSIRKEFSYKENDFISFTGDTYNNFFIIEDIISSKDASPLKQAKNEYRGIAQSCRLDRKNEDGERIYIITFQSKREIRCLLEQKLIGVSRFTTKMIGDELFVDEVIESSIGCPTYNVKAYYGKLRDEERKAMYAMEEELAIANSEYNYNEVMAYINN